MKKDLPPDPSADRLIRAGLHLPSEPGACPSVDLLAAYYERTLAKDEVARWERHFSECRRCQRVLAAMVRSDTELMSPNAEAEGTRSAWARVFDWRWLVPATAAASVVVVWIALQPRQTPSEAPALVAQQQQREMDKVAIPTPETERRSEVARDQAPVERRMSKDERQEAPRLGDAAKPATTAKSPAPAALPPQIASVEEQARAVAPPEPTSFARATGLAPPIIILAPGGRVRWRIGPDGEIGRSRDSGATWEAQVSATNRDLLAGSAPTSDVCWVVGRSGTILRTTDGERWEPVSSPVSIDIISIEATDESSAIIQTIDGQRFSTRDAGKTWERR